MKALTRHTRGFDVVADIRLAPDPAGKGWWARPVHAGLRAASQRPRRASKTSMILAEDAIVQIVRPMIVAL